MDSEHNFDKGGRSNLITPGVESYCDSRIQSKKFRSHFAFEISRTSFCALISTKVHDRKIIPPSFHVEEFQITRLLIRKHVMVFEQPFIVICYVMTSSYSYELVSEMCYGDINHVICFV